MFLRFAVALSVLWCAIELQEVLLFPSYISPQNSEPVQYFRVQMDSTEIFHGYVSVVCRRQKNRERATVGFCRDAFRCGYWLQAERYLPLALCYSNGLVFQR